MRPITAAQATNDRSPVAAALLVGALTFAVYVRTAAPTITWEAGAIDGAELAAAAAVLGVPHPTGYPLYMILGRLFTWLPIGEVAFRVALLSALAGGIGAALAGVLAARLAPDGTRARVVAASSAALVLGASPLYWSQATIPEVYTLHIALALAMLVLLTIWSPGRDGVLAGAAVLFGLGLGNHLTLALLALPAGVFVLAREPALLRSRRLIVPIMGFIVGASIYIYLPMRAAADPPLNWGNPRGISSLLAHVSGRAYHSYVASRPVEEIFARVPAAARLVGGEITWPGLALGCLGIGELLRTRPALARALLAYVVLSVGFALVYFARDVQVYLLPVVAVLAVGVGVGLAGLIENPRAPAMALTCVLAIVGWQLITNGPDLDRSHDHAAADYAREALASVPDGGVALTDRDEHTFALRYAQVAWGLRSDVAVVDVRLLPLAWYREQIERRRPGLIAELERGQ